MLEPHRTLSQPGAGINRHPGPATAHSEYPKHMVHPGYQPGIAAKEVAVPDPVTGKAWRKAYVGGTSIRLPPVLAMDEDQEAYHASQGYVTIGKSDPAAFARAIATAAPSTETHVPDQYPKWIAELGRSVNSEAEEAEALALVAAAAWQPAAGPRILPASSEQTGDAPALGAEVATLLDRPDIALADGSDKTRLTEVEWQIKNTQAELGEVSRKVDQIVGSFSRLEGMMAKIIAGPEYHSGASVSPGPKSRAKASPICAPKSAARSEAIKAGIARRKEAQVAAEAPSPAEEPGSEPTPDAVE
jgi:hypothetical protein